MILKMATTGDAKAIVLQACEQYDAGKGMLSWRDPLIEYDRPTVSGLMAIMNRIDMVAKAKGAEDLLLKVTTMKRLWNEFTGHRAPGAPGRYDEINRKRGLYRFFS